MEKTEGLGDIPLFGYSERDEYELALRIGERRFGSPCKHESTKDGKCSNCCRKVVVKGG